MFHPEIKINVNDKSSMFGAPTAQLNLKSDQRNMLYTLLERLQLQATMLIFRDMESRNLFQILQPTRRLDQIKFMKLNIINPPSIVDRSHLESEWW
jgi:hypothetical protein